MAAPHGTDPSVHRPRPGALEECGWKPGDPIQSSATPPATSGLTRIAFSWKRPSVGRAEREPSPRRARMPDAIARSCIFAVTAIAFARSVWVVIGFVRTLLRGRSLVATKWGWVEFSVVPEPLVIAAVAYVLVTHEAPAVAYSALRVAGAAPAGAPPPP